MVGVVAYPSQAGKKVKNKGLCANERRILDPRVNDPVSTE